MFAGVTVRIGPQNPGKSSGRNYETWPHSTILSHSDLLLLFLAVPDNRLPLCPLSSPRSATASQWLVEENVSRSVVTRVPAPVHIGEHLALQDKREISSLPGRRGCVPRGDPSLAGRLLPASRAVSCGRCPAMVSFHGAKRPGRGSGPRWGAAPRHLALHGCTPPKLSLGVGKVALEAREHVRKNGLWDRQAMPGNRAPAQRWALLGEPQDRERWRVLGSRGAGVGLPAGPGSQSAELL